MNGLSAQTVKTLGQFILLELLLLLALPSGWADVNEAKKAIRLQQFERAVTLYEVAAKAGDAEAQYQLATLHQQGKGTRKNPKTAKDWLEKAAAQNHPGAQYLLALDIQPTEPERAKTLLEASAKQDHRPAKAALMRSNTTTTTSESLITPAQRWFAAAKKGDLPTLQTLVRSGFNLQSLDNAGRNALFGAVASKRNDSIRWLLDQGVKSTQRDAFGISVAQVAIEFHNDTALSLLLSDSNQDAPAIKSETLKNGDNLLHAAIRHECESCVKTLLTHGIQINHQNAEGWTPLDLAQFKKEAAILAQLKDASAQPGAGWQHQAVAGKKVEQVANQLKSQSELPPAALAINNSHVALLKQILNDDPTAIHARLPDDSTLLVLAVKQNKPKLVAALLDAGADINQQSARGQTAFARCCATGTNEIGHKSFGSWCRPFDSR